MRVLSEHPAVAKVPERLVLVENLGASTVNMRVYSWINMEKYGRLKVRSAWIRQAKDAFEKAGISMPGEAREMVFPTDVPVRMLEGDLHQQSEAEQAARLAKSRREEEPAVHSTEGDRSSEADDINERALRSRSPEQGQDLLEE